ncbi:MAG: RidA family protein [Oscillospiraceae bacterium]|nr:RidA family protein [Oscillospiraceae bacterium]
MGANERLEKKAYELGINEELFGRDGLMSVRRVDNLLFTSGSGCGNYRQGLVGSERTFEDGYLACQRIALIQLGMIKKYLGDLDKVDQVLRVYGHLTVDDSFHDLDKMADGFSDVFGAVFGDKGICTRTLLGSRNLPVGNTSAELEVILAVKE